MKLSLAKAMWVFLAVLGLQLATEGPALALRQYCGTYPTCGGSCPPGFECLPDILDQTDGPGGSGARAIGCSCYLALLDPSEFAGNCGETHQEAGCTDAACEQCVCDLEPGCCGGGMTTTAGSSGGGAQMYNVWDELCVGLAAGRLLFSTYDGSDGSGAGTMAFGCAQECLLSNRVAAPAVSPRGLVAGAFLLLALGAYALRRRSRA